jgi:hypothetical protein
MSQHGPAEVLDGSVLWITHELYDGYEHDADGPGTTRRR